MFPLMIQIHKKIIYLINKGIIYFSISKLTKNRPIRKTRIRFTLKNKKNLSKTKIRNNLK